MIYENKAGGCFMNIYKYSIGLLLLSLRVLVVGYASVSLPSICTSDYASTNNSYQMNLGEQLNAISHSMRITPVDEERLIMYVPVNPTPATIDDLSFVRVQANQVTETEQSVVEEINKALQPTSTGPGQTVWIYYQLTPNTEANQYVYTITVVSSNSSTPIYTTRSGIVLESTLTSPSTGETIGTFPFPAKQLMQASDLGNYSVPAVPYTLPMVISTSLQTDAVKQGRICFTKSADQVGQQALLYTAKFTFLPAPFTPHDGKKETDITNIVETYLLQKGLSQSVLASKIAKKLKDSSYNTVAIWNADICPVLTKLNVPSTLASQIAQQMGLRGVVMPSSCSRR